MYSQTTVIGSRPHAHNQFDDEKNQKVAGLIRRLAELSIKGSGDRIVLGEQDAAIMEALNKGGKFIDLGAEAEQMLQQSQMDPYVIHAAAVVLEMQHKISAIEFASINIDRLLQEWHGEPMDRAPIHVRQALWRGTMPTGSDMKRVGMAGRYRVPHNSANFNF